jgi:hypothetical protein
MTLHYRKYCWVESLFRNGDPHSHYGAVYRQAGLIRWILVPATAAAQTQRAPFSLSLSPFFPPPQKSLPSPFPICANSHHTRVLACVRASCEVFFGIQSVFPVEMFVKRVCVLMWVQKCL